MHSTGSLLINARRGIACALAACLLCLCILCVPARAADAPRVLRVAFPEVSGISMTDADGRRHGVLVDFLEAVANYTGWRYEYIDVSSNELTTRFLSGEFDLMGGQYYMEEIKDLFGYPAYSCGQARLVLLKREDDMRIASYDLKSLNGMRIGVFARAAEATRRLELFLSLNGLSCELVPYTSDQLGNNDIHTPLNAGEVDLILSNGTDVREGTSPVATFDAQPHYIVTRADDQALCRQLEDALRRVYEADPNFAARAYETNFPAIEANLRLTDAERAYAEEKKTITVAVPKLWHPLFCLDTADSHNGLTVDMSQQVARFSGLAFSWLRCEGYQQALDAVLSGEADVLGFYLGNAEQAAAQGLALTAPYAQLEHMLVRGKNIAYPAEGLTAGVLQGQSLPDTIQAAQVRYYASAADALGDVNRGRIDLFYGVTAHIDRALQEGYYSNLSQAHMDSHALDVCFAIVRPVQPELFAILNKAIAALSEAEQQTMLARNLFSIGNTHFSLQRMLYANPPLTIAVVTLLLLAVVVFVIVVTTSRMRAMAIQAELERAEAESRAKSAFLSRMSHEIRTPMNAILGFAELAERTPGLPPPTQGYLEKLRSSSQYLLELLNDILDMSNIESHSLDLCSAPFSLGALMADLDHVFAPQARCRGMRFSLSAGIQHDRLTGDALRLKQVLADLLSNAFKFTPNGGEVCLCVTETQWDGHMATFAFCVSDTGCGIAPEDQNRVFECFEQLGSNMTQSQGTGLGLPIARAIVERMGGKLTLCSEPGKGSLFGFTVTLPASDQSAPQSEPTPVETSLEGMRILLAEDNDLNAEIAKELLCDSGAQVERVATGREVVERFAQSPSGTFDAILMDIMMPQTDGVEATRTIRLMERPDAADIPIIALSANALACTRERAQSAGMTGFVAKPIDIAHLCDVLRSQCRRASAQEENL